MGTLSFRSTDRRFAANFQFPSLVNCYMTANNLRNAIVLLVLLPIGTPAQTAAAANFEVASVKPSQPGPPAIETGPDHLTMRHVRMNACIAWAFDIEEPQIVGPGWLN